MPLYIGLNELTTIYLFIYVLKQLVEHRQPVGRQEQTSKLFSDSTSQIIDFSAKQLECELPAELPLFVFLIE